MARQIIFLLLLLLSLAGAAGARVWRATPSSGLGALVSRTAAGDTVLVTPGVYLEDSVIVSRPLTILGRDGAVLDGADGGHGIIIRADDVTIRGLRIRNTSQSYRSDYAAISAENAANTRVLDCILEHNYFGIYLARCQSSLIRGNTISTTAEGETSAGNGIHLWHCRDTVIENNSVRGHRDGIYLEFVRGARILGNQGQANLRYGLHFMFSDSCHYLRNTFSENGAGVAVMYSHHVEMSDNTFRDNWGPAAYGVLLKEITDSELRGNRFEGNTTGLHVEASNRIHAFCNTFHRNGWALRLMSNSTENLFEDNQFSANAFDVGSTGQQNYSIFRRNYWDRYRGYDLNHDGLGDVPHRPVSLFSRVVSDQAPALVLMRSLFVDLLEMGERAFPLLSPISLQDEEPLMRIQP